MLATSTYPAPSDAAAADLRVPAATRRLTSSLARDLAASAGHVEWRDIPDETRRDMRAVMVAAFEQRIGAVRRLLRLNPGDSGTVERIVRLEQCLAAARRLA